MTEANRTLYQSDMCDDHLTNCNTYSMIAIRNSLSVVITFAEMAYRLTATRGDDCNLCRGN